MTSEGGVVEIVISRLFETGKVSGRIATAVVVVATYPLGTVTRGGGALRAFLSVSQSLNSLRSFSVGMKSIGSDPTRMAGTPFLENTENFTAVC